MLFWRMGRIALRAKLKKAPRFRHIDQPALISMPLSRLRDVFSDRPRPRQGVHVHGFTDKIVSAITTGNQAAQEVGGLDAI